MTRSEATDRETASQGVLAFAPVDLRRVGLSDAHPRPLVGRRTDDGFESRRLLASPAVWQWPHVEMRTGSSYTGLFFDVDRPDSAVVIEELTGCEIPRPSFLVTRHENGHSCAAWLLSAPVHRYPGARVRPLQAFTRTAEYIHQALGADAGYTGVLVRNAHVADERFRVTWGPPGGYGLGELTDYIPRGWRRPRVLQTAVGRNCSLFIALMRWAGSHPVGDLAWRADALNAAFAIPLPLGEVRDTVRSVERYRREWAECGWHLPSWIAKQRARGRRGGKASGKARRQRTAERDADILLRCSRGEGIRAVARRYGIEHSTVLHVLRRDDPLGLWKSGARSQHRIVRCHGRK